MLEIANIKCYGKPKGATRAVVVYWDDHKQAESILSLSPFPTWEQTIAAVNPRIPCGTPLSIHMEYTR